MERREDLYCNVCGKTLQKIIINNKESDITEDHLRVKKKWGYFTELDQSVFEFRVCSECFLNYIKCFKIPVSPVEETEVL